MDLVETMAYRGDKPWHTHGVDVMGIATPLEMLVLASLDWKVSKRLLRIRARKDSNEEIILPGVLALVRDTDNRFYQTVTERYKPIQNDEVLDFFSQYCKAGGMVMETAGSLKNGAIIWALAKLGADFTLAGGDKVEGYMLLVNSHDGSMCFIAQFTSVRVVCWNTLSSALSEAGKTQFRMRHSKKFDDTTKRDAQIKLGLATTELRSLQAAAEYLSTQKVDHHGQLVKEYIMRLTNPGLMDRVLSSMVDEYERAIGGNGKGNGKGNGNTEGLLDSLVEQQEVEKDIQAIRYKLDNGKLTEEDMSRVGRGVLNSILSSPGSDLKSSKDTWWGVVNGVTHYADHIAGRERDTALQSAWFGEKAGMKRDALELALQVAEGKGGMIARA